MRIYATREDNGKPVLVALRCDKCGKKIKPSSLISKSGWSKSGWTVINLENSVGTDKSFEFHFCEEHAGR